MKASKFSEAQIAFVLKQAEDGSAVAEVCRKAGISEATFYNWRKKYAGLMPSEMKRLRQLEEENNKLKRIVADLSLWSEPLNFLQKWVESVTLRETEMKQSRFTEERIIAILREHEAGSKTGDVCRKHGISSATFYKWKAKYGGLDVSEARRLKVLTDENAKLKKLLAEAMLDNAMLKDLNSKKW